MLYLRDSSCCNDRFLACKCHNHVWGTFNDADGQTSSQTPWSRVLPGSSSGSHTCWASDSDDRTTLLLLIPRLQLCISSYRLTEPWFLFPGCECLTVWLSCCIFTATTFYVSFCQVFTANNVLLLLLLLLLAQYESTGLAVLRLFSAESVFILYLIHEKWLKRKETLIVTVAAGLGIFSNRMFSFVFSFILHCKAAL